MKPIVGVNYFSGWWREAPNKWMDSGQPRLDWREKYINRIPLNGCYDDQETMDIDILTAEKYGIDFFQMLWYPVDSLSTECDELHRCHLNMGIQHFCTSPYNDRLGFVIEYCNHPPFSILDKEEWRKTCRLWAEYFAHPSYFTIDGSAVFKIHGLHYFREQCNNELSVMKDRIDVLKEVAMEYAQKEVIILGGIISEDVSEELLQYLDILDCYSVYMDLPQLEPVDTDYDYSKLLEYCLSFAQKCADLGIPFMPYFPAGWNPRPWHDPRPSFVIPDEHQIKDGVISLCKLIYQNPMLGIQKGDIQRKAFSIYAWNEFGEGGYLAPTLVEYDTKLTGLKRALESVENIV